MEHKSIVGRIELKFVEPGTESALKEISGYGAYFNNIDACGDIIVPGAFRDTIEEHKAAGKMPAMLVNHGHNALPVGVWTDLAEDEIGLKVAGHFLSSQAALETYEAVKAGAITGLSIGYFVEDFEIATANGQSVRKIKKASIFEISLVTFPANDKARISSVKSIDNEARAASFAQLSATIIEALNSIKLLIDQEEVEEIEEEIEAEGFESDDLEGDDDKSSDEDMETKYNKAAIEAVSKLILKLKQEKNG